MTRAVPRDFHKKGAELSNKKLAKHYKCAQSTIAKWRIETGVKRLSAEPDYVPADFAILAPTMIITELERHYGVRHGKIKAWAEKAGVKVKRNGLRPPPDGFADDAPSMVKSAMMKRYKADIKTVNRWLSEVGVLAAEQVRIPPPRSSRPFVFRTGSTPKSLDLRQRSLYDDAADILRRERFVVYRCDDNGRFNERGSLWRRGNSILTGAELLEKAARYASTS